MTRNAEFITSDEKERAVNLFYTVYGEFILLLLKLSDRIVQDVRNGKSLQGVAIDKRGVDRVEYGIKTLLFVMLSLGVDDAIASPKLNPILHGIMNKRTAPNILRMLCAFTLLDTGNKQWHKNFAALLKEIGNNPYATKIVAERLYIYYRTTVLNGSERLEFEQFIADLEITLGASPRAKGRIMQQMRTAKLRAENAQ